MSRLTVSFLKYFLLISSIGFIVYMCIRILERHPRIRLSVFPTADSSQSQDDHSLQLLNQSISLWTDQPMRVNGTFIPPKGFVAVSQYKPNKNTSSPFADAVVVLHWNRRFGIVDWLGKGSRTSHNPQNGMDCVCNFTSNKADLDKADYVVVHAPDYYESPLPKYHRPGQHWLIFTQESPHYTEGLLGDAQNLRAIQGLFNQTASYRWDADIYVGYGYCRPREWDELLNATPVEQNFARGKTKIVSWFVSHCPTQSLREKYVNKLRQYVSVDVYGWCGEKKCPKDRFSECLSILNATYKFYLSFENSLCEDYITEKLFDYLIPKFSIVPIVLGGANYSRLLPPDSYIDVKNFSSPQKLAEYLKYLDGNDDAYNRYFRWRQFYRCDYVPDICIQMHAMRERVSPTTNIGRDWSVEGACQSTNDYYKNIL